MKRIFLAILVVLCMSSVSFANVWVGGYYKKDGTYVDGHYRSDPDSQKWNNYGPKDSDSSYDSPYTRDKDNDGMPNYLDQDDDNDGTLDDNE